MDGLRPDPILNGLKNSRRVPKSRNFKIAFHDMAISPFLSSTFHAANSILMGYKSSSISLTYRRTLRCPCTMAGIVKYFPDIMRPCSF